MKTAIINTELFKGGAAKAAQRLHLELLNQGVESFYLTSYKKNDSPAILAPKTKFGRYLVHFRYLLNQIPVLPYPKPKTLFSPAVSSALKCQRINDLAPQIVHLHWITNGFLSIESIAKIRRPVVWTLHDSWAFTGGCHLPGACERYQAECGLCPVLSSSNETDLSSWIYTRKKRAWGNFVFVSPSRWLAGCAKASTLLTDSRIEVIPNGIDCRFFSPGVKVLARRKLNLPENKKIILCSGMNVVADSNKGFDLLQNALKRLPQGLRNDSVLLVAGATAPMPAKVVELCCETIFRGVVDREEELVALCVAADVSVVPSRQENLPCSVMESMACGTPVVAFDVGGISDMVEHDRNGYLAKPFDAQDFACGIERLADENRNQSLGKAARQKMETEFCIKRITRQHIALYQEIINASKPA